MRLLPLPWVLLLAAAVTAAAAERPDGTREFVDLLGGGWSVSLQGIAQSLPDKIAASRLRYEWFDDRLETVSDGLRVEADGAWWQVGAEAQASRPIGAGPLSFLGGAGISLSKRDMTIRGLGDASWRRLDQLAALAEGSSWRLGNALLAADDHLKLKTLEGGGSLRAGFGAVFSSVALEVLAFGGVGALVTSATFRAERLVPFTAVPLSWSSSSRDRGGLALHAGLRAAAVVRLGQAQVMVGGGWMISRLGMSLDVRRPLLSVDEALRLSAVRSDLLMLQPQGPFLTVGAGWRF